MSSNRSQHAWFLLGKPWRFKCALCGGVTNALPESGKDGKLTDPDWMPTRFEPLTAEDRAKSPKAK